jgi:sugar lactone lactonase YvrE
MRAAGWVCVLMAIGVLGCTRRGTAPVAVVRAAPVEARGLAVDPAGTVYVGGRGVWKWDATGKRLAFDVGTILPVAMVADEEFLYVAGGGKIRRFSLSSGKEAPFTSGAIVVEVGAVRGMDVVGTTLYVADAKAGGVRMFDTESGEAKGDFSAPLPTALAVDALGQIWVAYEQGTIRAFRSDGYAGVTYTGPDEVPSMAFGLGGKLYVVDAKGGRVVTPGEAGMEDVLPVGPGLVAVAADREGHLVTLERTGRVAKWDEGRVVWEAKVE